MTKDGKNRKNGYLSLAILAFLIFITITIAPAFMNIDNSKSSNSISQQPYTYTNINNEFASNITKINQTTSYGNSKITINMIGSDTNMSISLTLIQGETRPLNYNGHTIKVTYITTLNSNNIFIKYEYPSAQEWNNREKFIANNIFPVFSIFAFVTILGWLSIALRELYFE